MKMGGKNIHVSRGGEMKKVFRNAMKKSKKREREKETRGNIPMNQIYWPKISYICFPAKFRKVNRALYRKGEWNDFSTNSRNAE